MIDNDKIEILNVCAIGFCRRPFKVAELANKFHLAGLQGFRDGKENEKVRIVVSAVKGGDGENYSEETVVPNSISLTAMNTLEVDKIWEDNKVVDWRVMETASWMMDENVGMVQRDEEVRDNDVSAECGLRDELHVQTTKDADVISPICNGPSNRVNITEVIEYRGQQRKVRRISDVLLSEIPSPEQAVAPNQNLKKGRGRPKSKNTEDKRIVNGSLSDSDFVNRLLKRDGSDSIVLKMRGMKRVLKEWNRNSFGNVETQYQKIVDEIEALDARLNSEELGSEDLQRKRDLHSRLWAVSKMRESIWRQKSRAIWLAEGDRNTRFFHRQEKIRWVRNRITGLQNNGRWETTLERLKLLFARELRKHFARVPTTGMFDFNMAFSVLTMNQCKSLEVGFTEEDVKMTIWNCIGSTSYVSCLASTSGGARGCSRATIHECHTVFVEFRGREEDSFLA
ncbi:hypothetical protein V6N13_024192 [Hibiscus sabdariffa]